LQLGLVRLQRGYDALTIHAGRIDRNRISCQLQNMAAAASSEP
jgi:hypothetical protein